LRKSCPRLGTLTLIGIASSRVSSLSLVRSLLLRAILVPAYGGLRLKVAGLPARLFPASLNEGDELVRTNEIAWAWEEGSLVSWLSPVTLTRASSFDTSLGSASLRFLRKSCPSPRLLNRLFDGESSRFQLSLFVFPGKSLCSGLRKSCPRLGTLTLIGIASSRVSSLSLVRSLLLRAILVPAYGGLRLKVACLPARLFPAS